MDEEASSLYAAGRSRYAARHPATGCGMDLRRGSDAGSRESRGRLDRLGTLRITGGVKRRVFTVADKKARRAASKGPAIWSENCERVWNP